MQIDENKRPRSALKTYFAKNAIPTEAQFAQLIDSGLNQRDDGVVKPAGDALAIEAAGDDAGLKRAVGFYLDFADADPAWSIALKPRAKPADPASARLGWSVLDAAGNARLAIDAANGNVGVGVVAPSERLEVAGRVRAGAMGVGPWPANPNGYAFIGSLALDQTKPGNYALLQGVASEPGTTFLNSPTSLRLRLDNADKLVVSDRGVSIAAPLSANALTVDGAIRVAGSDIYFTETEHNHTGQGNAAGHAAIENAKDYEALMLLGRSVPNKGRRIRAWDHFEVNGTLDVQGHMTVNDKRAIEGGDTWLRLNQHSDFTSGVHTNCLFAPKSLNVGGHTSWDTNPGNGNVLVAGNLVVAGNIGSHGYPATPHTRGWGGGLRTWDIEVEATAWIRNGVQTGNRDLAEIYFADAELEPGDVVALADGVDAVALTGGRDDHRVIGIVSKEPGLLLGALQDRETLDADGRSPHPVALAGCTPCKVTDEGGPIRRGDLLTPAPTPGHAMRADPAASMPGTIVGKALGTHDAGAGLIDAFVMLR